MTEVLVASLQNDKPPASSVTLHLRLARIDGATTVFTNYTKVAGLDLSYAAKLAEAINALAGPVIESKAGPARS